ncbi:carboxypeptidase-like regulatory domain-containing protein [Rhodohalobacter mucosus]|nr:carboxypeptidase-like regulatory domain-containing protein [Rhodohalobacter mucosus]
MSRFIFRALPTLTILLMFCISVDESVAADTTQGKISAVSEINGRVVSAETGEPLLGVHVFLSGTKIGAVTNSGGYYELQSIPPGNYKLVVSIIGYGRVSKELSIPEGQSLHEVFELKPVVYELGEIYAGNLDEKWQKYLDRFTPLFIGESEFADSVRILNPEVLRFETRWWGRFEAEALAPLQIENRALGYRIIYYLDEFSHSGTRTRWDGEPLFMEMTPADSAQAAYWKANRRKAFMGSMRHFLISLVQESAEEEGFILYNLRRETYGYSGRNKYRTSSARLLRPGDEGHFWKMRFSGQLEIVYSEAEEDPRYIEWAGDLYRGPNTVQTSYLELNERNITVDPDGEVKEPYGATRFGYFAFHRLADENPREYRPEGFQRELVSN